MIRLFLPVFLWCERLLVSGLLISLVVPLTIVAYFSDTETATEQGFAATELRFQTTPGLAEDAYLGVGLTPQTEFTLPTALTDASTAAKLDIMATTEGDELFCTALRLAAAGYIGTVSGAAGSFATPNLTPGSDWAMTLDYETSNVLFTHGDTCLVDITVETWQESMPKDTAGYRDVYRYQVPVRAHLVVLNEIVPRPLSGAPEMIELYNNSDLPIDVAGWNITERTVSGNTINHLITSTPVSAGALIAYDGSLSTVVPPRGFLALKYNSSGYLNDSADTVHLIDSVGYSIDEYSYVNALPGEAAIRMPDGWGDWEKGIPTPGEANSKEVAAVISEVPVPTALPAMLGTSTTEEVLVGVDTAKTEIIISSSTTEAVVATTTEPVHMEAAPLLPIPKAEDLLPTDLVPTLSPQEMETTVEGAEMVVVEQEESEEVTEEIIIPEKEVTQPEPEPETTTYEELQ